MEGLFEEFLYLGGINFEEFVGRGIDFIHA